jgi:hypothetical protein
MHSIFAKSVVTDNDIRTFWLPKSDSSEYEYEDAFDVSPSRFAVADGATESSFAKQWAQGLVNRFVTSPPEFRDCGLDFASWLEPARQAWAEQIPADERSWNVEEKANLGAFAAFVGIEFIPADANQKRTQAVWRAIAFGDSCFFLISKDGFFTFPLEQTSHFIHRPDFLSSIPANNAQPLDGLRICEGRYENGDYFLLATDALASWIIKKVEKKERPWDKLLSLNTEREFSCFINELRGSNAIKDDDVTLLIIRIKDQAIHSQHDTTIAVTGGSCSEMLVQTLPEQLEASNPINVRGELQEVEKTRCRTARVRTIPFENEAVYPSLSRRSPLSYGFAWLKKSLRRIHSKKT